MPSVNRVLRLADRVVGWLCALSIVLAAVLMLVSFALVAWSVIMRYFLNQPIPWVDELVGYLLVGLVMMAAADALRRGEHIAVDVLTVRLGPRGRRITQAAGQVSVLLIGIGLVIGGWQTVAFTKMLGIISTGYLSVPMYLPQMLIPVGGALLGLTALGGLVRMALGDEPSVESAAEGFGR